jgi:chorismate--pyruvate lyase
MPSNPSPRSADPEAQRWLPAERLGQLDVDAPLRPWLIGQGLLNQRIKDACGDRFERKLVHQWPGVLDPALQSSLKVNDTTGLFREVALCCGGEPWVLARTVVPDSTLSLHPWLAELGETSLGEMLNEISGVERSAYEYARIAPEEALASPAALPESGPLWARRARIRLRGAPLMVREVFLPALGRSGTPAGRREA